MTELDRLRPDGCGHFVPVPISFGECGENDDYWCPHERVLAGTIMMDKRDDRVVVDTACSEYPCERDPDVVKTRIIDVVDLPALVRPSSGCVCVAQYLLFSRHYKCEGCGRMALLDSADKTGRGEWRVEAYCWDCHYAYQVNVTPQQVTLPSGWARLG